VVDRDESRGFTRIAENVQRIDSCRLFPGWKWGNCTILVSFLMYLLSDALEFGRLGDVAEMGCVNL
jgi:hypothetical protein